MTDCQRPDLGAPWRLNQNMGSAMRSIFSAALILAALAVPAAAATKQNDVMKACGASWTAMSAADKAKTTYKAYSADCMKSGGPKSAAVGGGMAGGAMAGGAMSGGSMAGPATKAPAGAKPTPAAMAGPAM